MGHEAGQLSPLVDEALEIVDGALLRLMDGLKRIKLDRCVNMVILADHGMTDISCTERTVLLQDSLPPEVASKIFLWDGPNGRVSNQYYKINDTFYAVEPDKQVPLTNISDPLSCKWENLVIMDKHDIPVRFHYVSHERIDQIQIFMADQWLVGWNAAPYCIKGQHGFDPGYSAMKALFASYGPAFKEGLFVDPFENLEVYNLLAHLTNIDPLPNNGTQGSLYHLLRDPPVLPPTQSNSSYNQCPYPDSDGEYEERANLTDTGCQCFDANLIREHDDRLNFTDEAQQDVERLHVPLGRPLLLAGQWSDDDVCVLHHTDFVSAYNHELRIPLWASFQLTPEQINLSRKFNCTRPDVRLKVDEQFNCRQYQEISTDMTAVQLFPSSWSRNESVSETVLTSNVVLMYTEFYQKFWSPTLDRISHWASSYQAYPLHIITGPAFDHNADGLKDSNITRLEGSAEIPVPSHFFISVFKCNITGECPCTDVLTFVLPNRRPIATDYCLTLDEYLLLYMARIRDVELMTGLQLMTSFAPQQRAIQLRIYTPYQLW